MKFEGVANLADAIALHCISGALSSQLSQAEKRLDVVTGLLKPKANTETVPNHLDYAEASCSA